LEQYLNEASVPCLPIYYKGKKNLPKALWHTYQYLKKHKVEIVHAHLLDAGLAGMFASYFANVPKRIYTRHYSSYHHVYHKKGLLYDKWINALSTTIIAVSEVVKKILIEWEHVPEGKVQVLHHGFPLHDFAHVNEAHLTRLRTLYQLEGKRPVIGVVSRYTQWKGIQYIVPAFQKILVDHPNAVLVLANAKGEYSSHIKALLAALPSGSIREIEFENDLYSLFHCFDIFVHCPIDWHAEAFGQVYVEALAAGLPCIFTKSGIAHEIAIEGKNCLLAHYQDSISVFKGMQELLGDFLLCQKLGQNAQTSVHPQFELTAMIHSLERLYD
jgi:glycosyltransferase involved in cell wall biosynthesis